MAYFSKRFERRFEEFQDLKAQHDLEERARQQREEKKNKREDEEEGVNNEYLEFSKSYLNEFIYHLPP